MNQLLQKITLPRDASAGLPTPGFNWIRYVLTSFIISSVYIALVKGGLSFTPEGTDITPVWPPAGFATAALFIGGLKYWPAIMLASLLGNSIFGYLSPSSIAMIICVDTLEGVAAAALLQRFKFRPHLARVRDVVALVCCTTFGSTVIAATLGTAVIYIDGQLATTAIANAWFVYWISNVTANLTLAPLVFTWVSSARSILRNLRVRRLALIEALVMLAAVIGLGVSVWFSQQEGILFELEYGMFPLLMWAGLRFGSGLTATVIALVSLTAILGTSGGNGPFSPYPVYTALFMMQMYVSVYALTGLIVAAVAEERAAAKIQVSRSRDSLEITVQERTKEISQASAMLQAVLDNVPSAVVACDAGGQLTIINAAARAIYGGSQDFSRSETWAEDFRLYHSDGITPLQESEVPLQRALHGESFRDLEYAVRPEHGEPRSILISGQPIEADSDVQGAVVAAQDVTEQRHAQKLHQLFELAAVTSNEAPDIEQAVLVILESVCRYIDWPIGHAFHVEKYKGRQIAESSDLWYVTDPYRLEQLRTITQGQRFISGVGLPGHVLSTGEPVWIADVLNDNRFGRVEMVGSPPIISAVAYPVMAGSEMVAILEFFSYSRIEPDPHLMESMKFVCTQLGRVYERADATRRLMSMTLRDPLTGRPNRLAFIDVLNQAIAHAKRRTGYSFAVLFLDLDRFKIVNDSLGHAVGDALLIEAADRINGCLREGDCMARLGGDEFTVFLDDLGQRSDGMNAAKVARRISDELAKPFFLGGEEAHVSASIGIVIGTPEYTDSDVLLRDADSAMYRAKAAGKARIEIFSPQMHAEAMNQLRLENDLRRALERNEFILEYQPIIALATGVVTGFEALIRWKSPDRGLVMPNEFLPLCEESGLIIPLGEWVLYEGCTWLKALHSTTVAGSPDFTLSINVSVNQFYKGMIASQVQAALSKSDLPGKYLKLEIVESILMKNPAEAVNALELLRKLGVQVMIDDFGTGYSSLSYLSRLPIDALKIDQSFVFNLSHSEHSAEIIRCIISMADALKLDVIAEGIETVDQAEALKRFGCKFGQGYFFSRPLASDIAIELAVATTNKTIS